MMIMAGLGSRGGPGGRGRLVMPTAVSPDQFKQALGLPLYSVTWPTSTDDAFFTPRLSPSLFLFDAASSLLPRLSSRFHTHSSSDCIFSVWIRSVYVSQIGRAHV